MTQQVFLTVATRIHSLGGKTVPDPQKSTNVASLLSTLASSFAASSALTGTSVIVRGLLLVDSASLPGARLGVDKFNADNPEAPHVLLGPTLVEPWGSFAPALNAAVVLAASSFSTFSGSRPSSSPAAAATAPVQRLLFLSAEAATTSDHLVSLLGLFDEDTLVVGAALPGHDVEPGGGREAGGGDPTALAGRLVSRRPLSGSTCPWNTLAVWSVPKLALTGFPLVSEGVHPEVLAAGGGGVEEVTTIALLQRLFGKERMRATLLVGEEAATWRVEEFEGDASRKEWHEKKMKSKIERPEAQCRLLFGGGGLLKEDDEGGEFGDVWHVCK